MLIDVRELVQMKNYNMLVELFENMNADVIESSLNFVKEYMDIECILESLTELIYIMEFSRKVDYYKWNFPFWMILSLEIWLSEQCYEDTLHFVEKLELKMDAEHLEDVLYYLYCFLNNRRAEHEKHSRGGCNERN